MQRIIKAKGNGGESIGERAFDSCDSLTQFDFPLTLKSIEDHAFFTSGISGRIDLSRHGVDIPNTSITAHMANGVVMYVY